LLPKISDFAVFTPFKRLKQPSTPRFQLKRLAYANHAGHSERQGWLQELSIFSSSANINAAISAGTGF